MTTDNQKAYEFLNPYNFVSTPNRSGTLYTTQVGGDHEAPSRGQITKDTISGWVDVELKATSPILLSDSYIEENKKKIVRKVRASSDKHTPEMLATSFKGALRSAYEAITNSRFGTFDRAHELFNTEPHKNKNLIPARILSRAGESPIKFEYYQIDSTLPRADKRKADKKLSCFAEVSLEKASTSVKKFGKSDSIPKLLFAILKLSANGFTLCEVFEELADMEKHYSKLTKEDSKTSSSLYRARGYLHWTAYSSATDESSEQKEHFFISDFLSSSYRSPFKVSKIKSQIIGRASAERKWSSLVQSHFQNTGNLSDPKAKAAWKLREGRTLWIDLERSSVDLYPKDGLRISGISPEQLAERSYHTPATELKELSAADRVFGWVRADPPENTTINSLRGSVKIHPPVCADGKSILEFEEAFPLAILSGAHTSQWRFYTTEGYSKESELRGRKFFLPHRLPSKFDDYWGTPGKRSVPRRISKTENKPEPAWYREYLSAKDPAEEDKVHTWIKSWVKPGTSFKIRIMLESLELEDAAFLIWLLDLSNHTSPDDDLAPQIGVGFGKPLGFGSMTMKIKDSCLSYGSTWKQRYSSLSSAAAGTGTATGNVTQHQLIQRCEDIVQKSPDLSSIQEQFLAVTTGWKDIPVHYPRESAEPVQEGYKWFAANKEAEKDKEAEDPQKLPLPKKNSAPILKTHK